MKITIIIQEDKNEGTEVNLCAPGKAAHIKAMQAQEAISQAAQGMLNDIVETATLDGIDEPDAIQLIPMHRMPKKSYSIIKQ